VARSEAPPLRQGIGRSWQGTHLARPGLRAKRSTKEYAMNAWQWMAAGIGACALVSCGGGSGSGDVSRDSVFGVQGGAGASFTVTNLVADSACAANVDPNLVNGWGVAFNPQGFVWVADNETSKSTLYDGNGVPQSLVVSIPAGKAGEAKPTGIVFNGSNDFAVSQGGTSAPSRFIWAGQAGTLAAWSPTVNPTGAITVYDGAAEEKIYTGLALAQQGSANRLYAADFHNRRIDVFDSNFKLMTVPGGFVDPHLPAGYAPFGIQAIENRIYVGYAKQGANGEDEEAGAGLGLLDVFDTAGTLINRLVDPGGPLNAPWGIALAPAGFGPFSMALLVGNFGDGLIHAFEPHSGALRGTLRTAGGDPVQIDGLWGIAFGNGLNSQPTDTLFFAAGPGDEQHGVYGRIDPHR
jgi:uncharacterized protein (TIGR03118 family)